MVDALAHPYLDEGRLRYHSCMCKCCYTTNSGMRQYTSEFETTAPQAFDDRWERKLTSVRQVKGMQPNIHTSPSCFNDMIGELMLYCLLVVFAEEMHKFIAEQLNTSRVPLCINPQSAAFKSFAR